MTWHALSFGEHYDPERVAFGPMVCHDEHLLGNGRGFETHHHVGVAIVTWVVSGALEHRDSLGSQAVLEPGTVGILYAGDGVDHSEIAAAPQTRFVQVWLRSDRPAAYTRATVRPGSDAFTEIARVGKSTFLAARLEAGASVAVPPGALRHLYVATGALLRNSLAEPAAAGDSYVIRGDDAATLTAAVPTELLLWILEAD